MKTDVYRNFIVGAECGNIGKAAEKICITQPALSKQIQSLETRYGAHLFQRDSKGLTLTAAGKILYDRTKLLCKIADETRYEINRASEALSTISIGVSSAIASHYWIYILTELQDLNTNIRFNVDVSETDTILDLLQKSLLDIGIIDKHPPSSFRVLGEKRGNPLLVASSESGWLENSTGAIPLTRLQGVPLCVTKNYLDRLVEACLNEGFFPNVVFTSTSWHSVMEWAFEGQAIAITHQSSTADFRLKNFHSRPLNCPSLASKTLVVSQNDQMLSSFAQQFVGKLFRVA